MSAKLDQETVIKRLQYLKSIDPHFQIFGATAHQYKLNPPLELSQVIAFETHWKCSLPTDYRYFLTEIGNGGAGPYYGLFPLGQLDAGFDLCRFAEGGLVGDLSAPFPYADAWNLPDEIWNQRPDPDGDVAEEEEDRLWEQWDQEREEDYWNPSIMNGAIPICHMGCALRQWLVVTGSQAGYVWNDYRVDDGGLIPLCDQSGQQMTFADWYLSWLMNPSKD